MKHLIIADNYKEVHLDLFIESVTCDL